MTCDKFRAPTCNFCFQLNHCVNMVYLSSRPRRMRLLCHLGVISIPVNPLTCAQ